MEALDAKLMRYIGVNTAADPSSTTTPSSPGIQILAQMLLSELRTYSIVKQAGIYTANGGYFVCAKILANQTTKKIPTIGFVAHMDTSPRFLVSSSPLVVNGLSTLISRYNINLRDCPYTEEELEEIYEIFKVEMSLIEGDLSSWSKETCEA